MAAVARPVCFICLGKTISGDAVQACMNARCIARVHGGCLKQHRSFHPTLRCACGQDVRVNGQQQTVPSSSPLIGTWILRAYALSICLITWTITWGILSNVDLPMVTVVAQGMLPWLFVCSILQLSFTVCCNLIACILYAPHKIPGM